MYSFSFRILVLGIICASAELQLRIGKNYDEFFIPVNDVVEEKAGSSFSLLCELIVNNDTNNSIDDHLTWIKGENLSNQTSLNTIIHSIRGINKSEKRFSPLLPKDKGNYYCISHKFNLLKNVTILVIDNVKKNDIRPMRETIFCNDQMFQCVSNGLCIIGHYVCDGKPDCKDESDESLETCSSDPCKDKIPCDDGRCIPSVWCCDRHHDLNCTVTNRPKCCQSIISEAYEELEYGYPNMSHSQQNGARYLFISVCIVSILFSIVLLLLIVSKVMIFAKKTALQQQHHSLCENIALRNQTNVNIIRANFNPTNIYTIRNGSRTPRPNIIVDTSEVSDPLLFASSVVAEGFTDQPPSYVDVLRSNRIISEPPPPYTSQEILNVHEESQQRS